MTVWHAARAMGWPGYRVVRLRRGEYQYRWSSLTRHNPRKGV